MCGSLQYEVLGKVCGSKIRWIQNQLTKLCGKYCKTTVQNTHD